jgi:hypothetical protein
VNIQIHFFVQSDPKFLYKMAHKFFLQEKWYISWSGSSVWEEHHRPDDHNSSVCCHAAGLPPSSATAFPGYKTSRAAGKFLASPLRFDLPRLQLLHNQISTPKMMEWSECITHKGDGSHVVVQLEQIGEGALALWVHRIKFWKVLIWWDSKSKQHYHFHF